MFRIAHLTDPHVGPLPRAKVRELFSKRFAGWFRNPEELAYGRSGMPLKALYRVRFAQSHVWADYAGAPNDTLDIDLYEHWLEHE